MAQSDKSTDRTEDLATQVARLQAQVDALMGAPVAPDLSLSRMERNSTLSIFSGQFFSIMNFRMSRRLSISRMRTL